MAEANGLDSIDPVDDMLGLALYAAARAMTARYRQLLDGFGLTYPQYLVLLVLNETGGVTMSALGDRLRLESSTLSPLAKRLEAQGLINRRRRAEDERTVVVTLTDGGRRCCAETARVVPEQISLTTGLNEAEQSNLLGRLRALEQNLDRSLALSNRT